MGARAHGMNFPLLCCPFISNAHRKPNKDSLERQEGKPIPPHISHLPKSSLYECVNPDFRAFVRRPCPRMGTTSSALIYEADGIV